eukprot:9513279-Ditylum_brightwellii.AAC.1
MNYPLRGSVIILHCTSLQEAQAKEKLGTNPDNMQKRNAALIIDEISMIAPTMLAIDPVKATSPPRQ